MTTSTTVTTQATWVCVDGNEAAASVAHRLSDVCAIYPITPASPMGELADAWSARGHQNIWGSVPRIIEMQSEAGAAGTLHGAIQAGALATSFTSSQGLLLMLPNMFKIAGELTPAVLHVAARAIATHALSIFGDHSDVMAARSTGWAMLASSTVQEAHDMAAIAHAASLSSRVPFCHFFDGFRTSHEVARIRLLSDDELRNLVDADAVLAHRARGMSPDAPVLRGTAQNPDVFFQGREAANPFHDAVPGIVAALLQRFAASTGRRYDLVEYHGAPDAERVIIAMGSAVSTIRATVDHLVAAGEKVGVLGVRLYRPFPAEELAAALPPSVRSVAVLDRCKEPGAPAEPLHLDVVTALADHVDNPPKVIGGRYGLGSKEFTPRDVAAVFGELATLNAGGRVKRRFTVGITDDVTHLSLHTEPGFRLPSRSVEAVFYGLGSDGTVGANKASVKLIGENSDSWVQGYFVYDSKKSGSTTISHLRFGPERIEAPYLIEEADFVAVHQFGLLERLPVLDVAKPGATVLLSTPHAADKAWDRLPAAVQHTILAKGLQVFVVDAAAVAKAAGLGRRVNTVMQACFFALAKVLPVECALELAKESARKSYSRLGSRVVQANVDAIDSAIAALARLVIGQAPSEPAASSAVVEAADAAWATVLKLIAGEGDLLPVSAMPAGGSFPTGTAMLEKRGLATELPQWDESLCIDCGKCTLACPHAAIRMKVYSPDDLVGAPAGFQSKATMGRDFPAGTRLTIQVAADDCTGCSICATVCPAASKHDPSHKSLDMVPAESIRDVTRNGFDFFLKLPEADRTTVRTDTVKGSQLLQPLFEFSGACNGCGETPYIKLVTQLLGDRMVVANATGCSSIFGGNLPTTPWTTNSAGRGPAWNNSLFEDNAEFGMGIQLGMAERATQARLLVGELAGELGLSDELVTGLVANDTNVTDEAGVVAQRERVEQLKQSLARVPLTPRTALLGALANALVPTSVWVMGGDGWAYDIGFGGLDHLFATGLDINVLVLDTEVYSNTGGQASKATPMGASAKFAAGGKTSRKKDLGLLAKSYGNVYVAQIAINANEIQAVRAIKEAAAYPGPSLVIAYSTCIAHGLDLADAPAHQKAAVASGHWPLYRYHPAPSGEASPLFKLDSKAPSLPLADFYAKETRYRAVGKADPELAEQLLAQAQADAEERYATYLRLSEH
ncbi:MAG: pyruvate:ferredoxin (flavodoxin) oxidoreductase [Propionicimonas sp.]